MVLVVQPMLRWQLQERTAVSAACRQTYTLASLPAVSGLMTAVKKGAHRASAAVMPGLWGRNHACSLRKQHTLIVKPTASQHAPTLAAAWVPS